MPYVDDYQDALDRTRRLGLTVPRVKIDPDPNLRYLTPDRQQQFPQVIHKAIGPVGAEELVAQCMSIHHRLQPVLEDWLGVPVVYTVGWVETSGDGLFKFDEAYVSELLQKAAQKVPAPRSLGVHVWLTLPSMELLDLSLATSIAFAQKMPEGMGRVMAKHANDVTDMAYKPMLLGDDWLRKIGALIEF